MIQLTVDARTEDDLDQAARHLATFVAIAGVAALLYLVYKGAELLPASATPSAVRSPIPASAASRERILKCSNKSHRKSTRRFWCG